MPRIDILKLHDLLDEGYSPAECARLLRVNKSSVSRAIHRGRVKTTDLIVQDPERLSHLVGRKLDIQAQILEVNRDALFLHRELIKYIKGDKHAFQKLQRKIESKKGQGRKTKIEEKIETFDFAMDPRMLMLSVQIMKEIRGQWDSYFDIFKTIYSLEEAQRFMGLISRVLEMTDPKLKKEFQTAMRKEMRPFLVGIDVVGLDLEEGKISQDSKTL